MNKYTYVDMPLGERVKQVRESKGISQRKLATTIFVDASALCYWEQGKRNISVQSLCDIADALEVSLDELVGRSRR